VLAPWGVIRGVEEVMDRLLGCGGTPMMSDVALER
jgi:hypothetical protein